MTQRPLKTLIHLHTDHSFDSDISLSTLIDFAKREGIGCIAVTDHDTMEGALRLRDIAEFKVIVGTEITTTDGHVIGLFIERHVPPGMSARDTAMAIRDQGGVVLVPHPFNRFLGCGVFRALESLAGLIDAVEINNAQNLSPIPDRAARRFARRMNLPAYVGADSHRVTSIAPCFQWMAEFDGPAGFIESLSEATLHPGRHPLAYFWEMGTQLIRYYARRPLRHTVGANS